MLFSKTNAAVVATALFYMSATAQDQYSIDPNSVSLAIRTGWCQQQKATCPSLCLQPNNGATRNTIQNTCDPVTLSYSCVCGGGVSPNATQYSQTLPYFICTVYGTQCVASCGGINTCQSACREDHPCGAQDPSPPNSTASVTTASTTPSPTAADGSASTNAGGTVFNGLGGAAATDAASSSKKNGAQAALDMGRSYGLAVVFTSIFAGFALIM